MTTQQLLDEANAAYHRLSIGAAVVKVHDSNGESIEFTPASKGQLLGYIRSLEIKLAGRNCNGPMRVFF